MSPEMTKALATFERRLADAWIIDQGYLYAGKKMTDAWSKADRAKADRAKAELVKLIEALEISGTIPIK